MGGVRVLIPQELAKRMDAVAPALGYTSRGDFVQDAVRRFLDQVNKVERAVEKLEEKHRVELGDS